MKLLSVEYIKGTPRWEDGPRDGLPEIAFIGRSNVGKSSLINFLLGRKIAYVSGTPGKTQLIHFYNINHAFYLVDLPGYGYAHAPKETRSQWGPMIESYLLKRSELRAMVLLIDIRHPLKEFDALMIAWAERSNIPLHILLTKADKLSRNQAANALNTLKKTINPNALITIQIFSSLTKAGLPDLENKVTDWLMDISLT